MSARSLALAAGAIVAMLATPVVADECSDQRAAFMLHESTKRTINEAINEGRALKYFRELDGDAILPADSGNHCRATATR